MYNTRDSTHTHSTVRQWLTVQAVRDADADFRQSVQKNKRKSVAVKYKNQQDCIENKTENSPGSCRCISLRPFEHLLFTINPLKPSVVRWLHLECSVPCRRNLPFSISDIRALWRSGLSARVSECQKLKIVGYVCMA